MSCKCRRTVCVYLHFFSPVLWRCPLDASMSVGVYVLLGKDWACSTLSPPPSPALSLFPFSLPAAVFLSELGSGAKLPPPPPSSRHKQELTDLLTSTNIQTHFVSPLPCPTLVWLLTVLWPHFGLQTEGQIFPLLCLAAVIGCLTLLCKNCLTILRNAFMVRCLTGHLCFLISCCCPLWHVLGCLSIYWQDSTELILNWHSSNVFSFIFVCMLQRSRVYVCARKILKARKWNKVEAWLNFCLKVFFVCLFLELW